MATRLRYPKGYQFFDSNGNPLALGKLNYYVAGTTTPQDTYSDSAGAVANTNPIVLDGSGRLQVDVYLGSSSNYREVLTTSSVTVSPWPDDNIERAITIFGGDSGSGGTVGYVPAPAAGDALANKFLKADGTWAVTPGGGGGVTNLSVSETASTVSIGSSSGSGTTIPAATSSAAGVLDSARAAKIDGLATVATSGSYNDLTNQPTLGTAAAKNAPASGNASAAQVVLGSDTRLSWTDYFSTSAELLTNPNFTSNLSGWTVSGDFVWYSGGGASSASDGTLVFNTGVAYSDSAIYHVRLDIAANSSNSVLPYLINGSGVAVASARIFSPRTGVCDFYWLSPGSTNGNEKLKIWAVGGCRINSVSFKRITYTAKSLVGGLDLTQGGQLKLTAGRQNAPAITFQNVNAANTGTTGVFWDDTNDLLTLVVDGTKTITFELDPAGAINGIYGNGSNRLTVGNQASLILQPVNGHMEWEGQCNFLNAINPTNFPHSDFEVVGYAPGSSIGKGIRFRSEVGNGLEPDYILAVHAGGAQSDAKPGLIVVDHSANINGTWYPNGNLTCQALTATNVVYKNASVNLTAGYTATADAIGTVSSGTTTLSQSAGDYHTLTNNGAFTLNPPSLSAPANCASGVIEVYNGASAGAITTTGWTKVNGSFDTTSGHWFQCDYCVTPRGAYLAIRAMQ
jgi:hypothetical protein